MSEQRESRTASGGPKGPLLDLRTREHLGRIVLGVAVLLSVVALVPAVPARVRVAWSLLLAAGTGLSALLAGLKRHRWSERAAFYIFLVLGIETLGHFVSASNAPVWPLLAVLMAAIATSEPLRTGLVVSSAASSLALASWIAPWLAAASTRGDWQLAGAAALTYPVIVLVLHRAVTSDRQRLERALTDVARMHHGIDQFTDISQEALDTNTELIQVSEEQRRVRRLEHDTSAVRSLETVVRLARRATGAHAVVYFAIDRQRDLAFLKASDGPDSIVGDAAIRLSEDPLAFVLDRGTSFYATDYDRLLLALPYYRGVVRIGTLLAIPVVTGDVTIGVLIADTLEIQSFTRTEPELLEDFARLASEALSQTRAAVSREEHTLELGALATVSAQLAEQVERRAVYRLLMRAAHDIVPFESAVILRSDEAETRYTVEGGSGWARDFKGREVGLSERTWGAWVLRSAQEPYLLDDLAGADRKMPLVVLDEGNGRAESLLAVPLRSANTNLGALLLMGRRGTFDATASRLLKILANQTAAILRTIWLVEQRTELAVRDGLTGLFNRRSFDDLLARAIGREERQDGRFALLMMDIDHFKKLNDTHGHQAGDEALRSTARLMESNLRKGDVAARYGGEEFIAILPGAGEEGGMIQAERVRRAVAAQAITFEGNRISVTASFGVAVWPEGGENATAILESADRALYAAKSGGRNRVFAASALKLRETAEDEVARRAPAK